MRPDLARIVDQLIAGSKPGDAIELDAIGEAIGPRAISQDEIDSMLVAIEASGRTVTSPAGGQGEAALKNVLDVARTLRAELKRAPRPGEIAERAGMTRAEVAHALALARVIQR